MPLSYTKRFHNGDQVLGKYILGYKPRTSIVNKEYSSEPDPHPILLYNIWRITENLLTLVDSPRIELGSYPCEGYVLPFNYEPANGNAYYTSIIYFFVIYRSAFFYSTLIRIAFPIIHDSCFVSLL